MGDIQKGDRVRVWPSVLEGRSAVTTCTTGSTYAHIRGYYVEASEDREGRRTPGGFYAATHVRAEVGPKPTESTCAREPTMRADQASHPTSDASLVPYALERCAARCANIAALMARLEYKLLVLELMSAQAGYRGGVTLDAALFEMEHRLAATLDTYPHGDLESVGLSSSELERYDRAATRGEPC